MWTEYIILQSKTSWKHPPGTQAASHNNRNQTNLPTCLRNSLLVILLVICCRHNLPKKCLGQRWGVQSNQAGEGTKINWRTWPRRRNFETCAGFFHWHLGSAVQLFDEGRTGTKWLAKKIVQNAANHYACWYSFRIPPDCNHTTVLPIFLPTWFWDGWKPKWKFISQKNNMVLGAADVWRTFGDCTHRLGQIFQCKRANLDCQPGLAEGFRPSTLASTMARSFRTTPFRTHDLGDLKFTSGPTGASCWHQRLQQVFPGCVVRCWRSRWRTGVVKCSIWVAICVVAANHCWT